MTEIDEVTDARCYCTRCAEQLESSQIGLCDSCQENDETEDKVAFTFAELSDEAKRVALEWYRVGVNSDWEPEYDDVVTCFGFLGIEIHNKTVTYASDIKRRDELDIELQLAFCQGDGVVFKGSWKAERMDIAALQDYAPQDTKLHDIGRQLTLILLRWPMSGATIATRSVGSGLSHMYIETLMLDGEDGDDEGTEGGTLEEIFKDCAQWMYDQFREDLEWQTEEAQCIEGIEASDYTFDEEGSVI